MSLTGQLDPNFKRNDPKADLAEDDAAIPAGLTVRVTAVGSGNLVLLDAVLRPAARESNSL